MRLTGLALGLLLVACGGSSKHAAAPAESTTSPAPSGGAPADGAATLPEPVEAAAPPEAPAPPAAAATPATTDAKTAPKGTTRGAVEKKKKPLGEDPDAGGE